jgi:hypothetical protein
VFNKRCIKQLFLTLVMVFVAFRDAGNHDVIARLAPVVVSVAREYCTFVYAPAHSLPCPHYDRTIDSFDDSECWRKFRTRKADLPRLMRAFRIPVSFTTTNRCSFTGEEVFLFSLWRFSDENILEDMAQHVFGREFTQWSRAFNKFVEHVFTTCIDILFNSLAFWVPFFPLFAEKIRQKLADNGCFFAPGTFNVMGFIDDTIREFCRPGGGPAYDGPGAPRFDPLLQQAFYNGWKKIHGLKWETLCFPNGLAGFMWGPCSARHNDLYSLLHSNLNDILLNIQAGNPLQYVMYGDAIFPVLSHLRRRHHPADTPRKVLENQTMPKVFNFILFVLSPLLSSLSLSLSLLSLS